MVFYDFTRPIVYCKLKIYGWMILNGLCLFTNLTISQEPLIIHHIVGWQGAGFGIQKDRFGPTFGLVLCKLCIVRHDKLGYIMLIIQQH